MACETVPDCTDPDCTEENLSFRHKVAYWRERGTPVKYTYGRDAFHGPTGAELGRETKREFRARHGFDPEPKSTRRELI